MVESLIDRDALLVALHDAPTFNAAADNVLDYLRSVLTPEALIDAGWSFNDPARPSHYVLISGVDLHRRIFGED